MPLLLGDGWTTPPLLREGQGHAIAGGGRGATTPDGEGRCHADTPQGGRGVMPSLGMEVLTYQNLSSSMY